MMTWRKPQIEAAIAAKQTEVAERIEIDRDVVVGKINVTQFNSLVQ